jgi:hypothetical protein
MRPGAVAGVDLSTLSVRSLPRPHDKEAKNSHCRGD